MNRLNQVLLTVCLTLLAVTIVTSYGRVHAQTAATSAVGIGMGPAAAYCTAVANCPVVTGQQSQLYVVTPSGAAPFLALAYGGWNGGAANQVTFPQGASGITSINGKTGTAVTIGYADLASFPASLSCPTGTAGPNGLTCVSGLTLK